MLKNKSLKFISLLWISSLLSGGSALLIQVLVARNVSISEFGVFSASISIIGILIPLVGFGVSQLLLKLFSEKGLHAKKWLESSYKFIFLNSLVISGLLLWWAFSGSNEDGLTYMLIFLIFHMLGMVLLELVIVKLQLEGRFPLVSYWQLYPNVLRLALVSVFIFMSGLSLELVGLVYAVAGGILILFGIRHLYQLSSDKFQLKNDVKNKFIASSDDDCIGVYSVISKSWPFGMAAFFQLIYYQSDIVILKYLSGNDAAAIYNVAFIILTAVFILPSVIYQKYLMPKIHYWASYKESYLYKVYLNGNRYMALLGVLAILVMLFLSDFLIVVVFGSEYAESVILLNILMLSVPFVFMAYNSGAVLVTKHHMYRKVKFMGLVAVVNVILNFIFIPAYGAEAAALTTVFSNMLLFVLYFYGVKRYVFN